MDPTPAHRKFTMADLMILIAGCAAGIAWARAYYYATYEEDIQILEFDWRFRLPSMVEITRPALTSIGAALLVCRLRPPRPTLRRLARQPGSLAMACMTLTFATEGTILLAGRALKPVVDRAWPLTPTPGNTVGIVSSSLSLWQTFTAIDAGPIIAACWLLLPVVGRWKPEPTWIDRSGRCLGACWIISSFASSLVNAMVF